MTYNEKIISMNNDLLDHQHKELFEISKKLSLMNQRHVGTKELKIVLRELLIMINRHFSDEEAFMREYRISLYQPSYKNSQKNYLRN